MVVEGLDSSVAKSREGTPSRWNESCCQVLVSIPGLWRSRALNLSTSTSRASAPTSWARVFYPRGAEHAGDGEHKPSWASEITSLTLMRGFVAPAGQPAFTSRHFAEMSSWCSRSALVLLPGQAEGSRRRCRRRCGKPSMRFQRSRRHSPCPSRPIIALLHPSGQVGHADPTHKQGD
jgi:hypothetical protein